MIQNEIEKVCMGCMNIHEKTPCEHCNFEENKYNEQLQSHILKPQSILNGKYIIGRVLGEGGFGITYLGLDLNLNLKLAIKEYYPSGYVRRDNRQSNDVTKFTGAKGEFFDKGLNKFLEEARNVAKFNQAPGIVRVVDFFRENSTAYMVMEYVEGITLKQYLRQTGGKVSIVDTLNMMKPVISSLALVHGAGLIHRDISPDNIMIDNYGNMKLIDFGAARDFANDENKSMSILLKPGFAPEEQYRTKGHQGPWSDVYALCATIYKMVTGITPVESLERRAEDSLEKLSKVEASVPENISEVIMKGMEILQENRIQNMQQLHEMLYSQELKNYMGHTVNSMYENTNQSNPSENSQNISSEAQGNNININENNNENQKEQFKNKSSANAGFSGDKKVNNPQKKDKKLPFIIGSIIVVASISIVIGMNIGKNNNDYSLGSVQTAQIESKKFEDSGEETTKNESDSSNKESLYNDIRNIIEQDLSNVNSYGFYFCDVSEKEALTMNGNESMKALGIAHMFLMAELGHSVYGYIDNTIQNYIGQTMTTINNEATNALIDLVGISSIDQRIKSLGLSYKTRFRRKMLDTKAAEAGYENTVTASDIGIYLKNLYNDHRNGTNSVLTKNMPDPHKFTNDMMYYMLNSQYKNGLAAIYDMDVKVYNKVGMSANSGYYNDVAIVETPKGAYVICILTQGNPYNDEKANQLSSIARITQRIYSAYMDNKI